MKQELSMEYIDEQIENHGCLEEYDDGISYCPYCGYASELDVEDYAETHDEERECGECGKFYLESIEIDVRWYTKTKRLEVDK